MMRGYCDFYRVDPSDERLLALATALIDNPAEGLQLIARDGWNTVGLRDDLLDMADLVRRRVGVLNDLYVAPASRGTGAGRALIERCLNCAASAAPRSWCGRRRRTTPRRNGFTTASAPRSRPG